MNTGPDLPNTNVQVTSVEFDTNARGSKGLQRSLNRREKLVAALMKIDDEVVDKVESMKHSRNGRRALSPEHKAIRAIAKQLDKLDYTDVAKVMDSPKSVTRDGFIEELLNAYPAHED